MNSIGNIKDYISKGHSNEQFIIFIGKNIEQQLNQWDEAYEVNIMKFKDYIFVVKIGATCYEMEILESLLAENLVGLEIIW
ncbi:hypothetical protein CIL05_20145 [Virgibacillus profundi]|uniref:Uncharacterized protein n=1 Tax=Virgibacillus profundi TaxID=2024555 RepID=A0A2A2I706_9BACI|nr:hypothetical protein [Virgibacillus profundi]PAV27791.1 hypothetical protein CIL05_20145 [Virgibacillus profundi]PXY52013.1 hypothetical protein CIT14_20125 [Virgibacillus profundi]